LEKIPEEGRQFLGGNVAFGGIPLDSHEGCGIFMDFHHQTTHQKTTVTDEEVECDATMDKMNFGFLICKLPRYLHPPKTKHGTRFSQNLKESTLVYFILLIFSSF